MVHICKFRELLQHLDHCDCLKFSEMEYGFGIILTFEYTVNVGISAALWKKEVSTGISVLTFLGYCPLD